MHNPRLHGSKCSGAKDERVCKECCQSKILVGSEAREKPSTCSRSARKQITGTESDLSPPFPSACLVRKGQGAGQGEQELRAAEQNAGCNHRGLLFCFALLVLKLPTSPGRLFQIPAVKVQLSLSLRFPLALESPFQLLPVCCSCPVLAGDGQ